jgi:glycosyltransferase involved in cell wall biosynthesis
MNESLPFVSFIIPTYNAEDTLEACLNSIIIQDYPHDKFEIIIVDGGSSDKTLDIATRYPVKILYNKKRPPYNQEGRDGGKALGLSIAKGELIAFVDADNILSSDRWLREMVQPFIEDPELVACETARMVDKKDPPINRYCSALVTRTPRGDPFVFSHSNAFGLNVASKRERIIYRGNASSPPCLANGTIVRKEVLKKVGGYDYDWDTGMRMVNMGFNKFCKVMNVGIYHKYVESLSALVRKGIWRIRYFLYTISNREIKKLLPNLFTDKRSKVVLLWDFISGLTLMGPLIYAVRKLKEERDYAWLYHPLICFMIPLIYMIVLLSTRKGISLLYTILKGEEMR